MDQFRSPRATGRFVAVLLLLNGLASIGTLISGVMQLQLLERIATGDFTHAELQANDTREMLLGFATLALYLLTAVCFAAWFKRAYENLPAFEHAPRHGTGWAAGAWFVPILNLVRPYQIAKEIWNASEPVANAAAGEERTPPLLVAWWTTWILGNVVGQVAFRLSMNAAGPAEAQSATVANLCADGLTLICAPLAALVVHEITRRQELTAARLRGDSARPLEF